MKKEPAAETEGAVAVNVKVNPEFAVDNCEVVKPEDVSTKSEDRPEVGESEGQLALEAIVHVMGADARVGLPAAQLKTEVVVGTGVRQLVPRKPKLQIEQNVAPALDDQVLSAQGWHVL